MMMMVMMLHSTSRRLLTRLFADLIYLPTCSGAGKTEAAKQCLSYLTESTENQSKSLNSSKERISQIANIANR